MAQQAPDTVSVLWDRARSARANYQLVSRDIHALNAKILSSKSPKQFDYMGQARALSERASSALYDYESAMLEYRMAMSGLLG